MVYANLIQLELSLFSIAKHHVHTVDTCMLWLWCRHGVECCTLRRSNFQILKVQHNKQFIYAVSPFKFSRQNFRYACLKIDNFLRMNFRKLHEHGSKMSSFTFHSNIWHNFREFLISFLRLKIHHWTFYHLHKGNLAGKHLLCTCNTKCVLEAVTLSSSFYYLNPHFKH